MPNFNTQDWVEDRMELPEIDEKLYYDQDLEPSELLHLRAEYAEYLRNGAVQFWFDRNEINQKSRDMIEDNKQSAYKMEVDLHLESMKNQWHKESRNTPVADMQEVIKYKMKVAEKKLHEIEIDFQTMPAPDSLVFQAMNGGAPDLKHLKGSEYLEIKNNYELMKEGSEYEVTYYCYGSDKRAAWLLLKYLESSLVRAEADVTLNNTKRGNDAGEENNKETTLIIKAEIRQKLYDDLKHFFAGQEELFYDLLVNNKPINEKLPFPGQQNAFVELFQRLKYNGYVSNPKTEIKRWIVKHFTFKRILPNGKDEQVDFNEGSVENILKGNTKNKSVTPLPEKRLCTDWLEFKTYSHIKKEKEN